jgi:hypothetical protein
VEAVVQQRQQILIEDLPLLVGERRERLVQLLERLGVGFVAELLVAALERMASTMLDPPAPTVSGAMIS